MNPFEIDLLEFDDGRFNTRPVHPRIAAYVETERQDNRVPFNKGKGEHWAKVNNEIMRTIPSWSNRLEVFVERRSLDEVWHNWARLCFEGRFVGELEYLNITPNDEGTEFEGRLGWTEDPSSTSLKAYQESNPMYYKIHLNGNDQPSGVMVLLGNDAEYIRRLILNGPTHTRRLGEKREIERQTGQLVYENGRNGFEFPLRSHGLLQKDSTNEFCRSSGLLPFHLNTHFQESVTEAFAASPPANRATRDHILTALHFRKQTSGVGPFQRRQHLRYHPLAFPLPRNAWYDSDEESSAESEHSSDNDDSSPSTTSGNSSGPENSSDSENSWDSVFLGVIGPAMRGLRVKSRNNS